MRQWRKRVCVALAIAGGLTATTVRAEEITERERELLIVIESLKERVTALEEREAASAPAARLTVAAMPP